MKILIVNATLASRTGTETYVRDLAIGLLRRGHEPLVYAPDLGEIADELRLAAVPVVNDLRTLNATPDVIHGNHNTELMTALLHFPRVPAVFVCHSSTDWNSAPPAHPRIRAYVAVDDACRERLTTQHAIADEHVRITLHGVDQERFKPRAPLPEKPGRALVFSNNANGFTHLPQVEKACERAGITLDVIGAASKTSHSRPENLLRDYDLVFAKARCALESLVVGTAVILCDTAGCGSLVTAGELERLRRLNFGIRTLSQRVDAEVLLREIKRYDANDATEVSRHIRAAADISVVIDQAIAVYKDVIADYQNVGADGAEETRAAAEYLRWLTFVMRQNNEAHEDMFASSRILQFRHALGRIPLFDRSLKRLGDIVRRNHGSNNDRQT